MLEDPEQVVELCIILLLLQFPLGYFGFLLYKKKLINKKNLYYIYYPLTSIPTFIVATYMIWPGNSRSFVIRIIVGTGISIIVYTYVYLVAHPSNVITARFIKNLWKKISNNR